MPPVPDGKVYANYTATVEEVLELELSVDVNLPGVQERFIAVLEERIQTIADLTNVSLTTLSGGISFQEAAADAGVASATPTLNLNARPVGVGAFTAFHASGRGRKLVTAEYNTTNCNDSLASLTLSVTMESTDPAERDAFLAALGQLTANDITGIDNATGFGDDASVCVPWVLTESGRETVDAVSPPPPLILPQETPDPIPRNLILILAVVGALVVLFTLGVCTYFALRTRGGDNDEKEPLKSSAVAPTGRRMVVGKGVNFVWDNP